MIGEKQSVRGRRDMPMAGSGSTSGSEESYMPALSPEEKEYLHAKMFLMNQRDNNYPSLYDHLAGLISTLLDGETENGLSQLEEISRTMKRERIRVSDEPLRDHVPRSHSETIAKAQWNLLKKSPPIANTNNDLDNKLEEAEQGFRMVPDVVRQAAFFEMAGYGLPREEIIRISLALSDLLNNHPEIKTIRFWGKILGTVRNYFIAETELREEDYIDDMSVTEEQNHESDELPSDLREEDSTFYDDSLLPDDLKPMWKPPPKIPCEPAGTGLNKKVYFVTQEPGLPWIKLPHVTPAQVHTARKIRKFFTGDLESQVVTYPPFPGVEKNYLRVQIARISASTQVSPLGFFRFDDEGEEEEAEEAGGSRTDIIMDGEWEGMATRDLADPGLQGWVHHSPAILPQGRTTWWNPVQHKGEYGEEEEGEDEDEERNEPDEPEPETAPPLLTPLAEDENVGNSPPWIAKTSSKFMPEFSIAVVQSNVWVGAVAFAADKGKFFENLYVGWGQKNLEAEFEPALPDMPMSEFPSGPEITEADDPTPEEEAAVRAALQEKELEAEFEQIQEDDDDIDEDEGGE